MEQMLEDSKAINRTQKIIFIVLGAAYELMSIIFAFANLDFLLSTLIFIVDKCKLKVI